MVESTYDLLNIIRPIKTQSIFASIDVENLFTNVPVKETTDIILEYVFNHESIPPPQHLSKKQLKDLLLLCTTQTSFMTPENIIYQQIDGVSMGSPLGPIYANYYMSHIENNILPNMHNPPTLYCRYVDDTLLLVNNQQQLNNIVNVFKNNSVLNFTSEIEKHQQINFLDITIKRDNGNIITSIFKKPTASDDYINFNGCCPQQYKIGVIKTLLHRAYHNSSNYQLFNNEIDNIKQALINNNFPIQTIDKAINNFISQKITNNIKSDNIRTIDIYYKNQMTSYYKNDEKQLQKIISKYIKPKEPDKKVKLLIYYKTRKLKNLLIKNNLNHIENKDHIVYEFTCPENSCNAVSNYIGHSTNTLLERMKQHTREGSIKRHMKEQHNKNLDLETCINNTKIIGNNNNRRELIILESLLIKQKRPLINIQTDKFDTVLKIFK